MFNAIRFPTATALLLAVGLLPQLATPAASYDGLRWFQIEISIFSNDYPEYQNAELWSADRLQLAYPERVQPFGRLSDFLMVEQWQLDGEESAPQSEPTPVVSGRLASGVAAQDASPAEEQAPEPGPFPRRPESDLGLPDFERDPFLLQPESLSDFQTTNSRLQQSADHRLLFSGLWRQPVVGSDRATALLVQGGRRFGQRYELEGSITVRFNRNQDRVVIDTDLWRVTYSPTSGSGSESEWDLPALPEAAAKNQPPLVADYTISRLVQMRQSRDMRSNEFHYLDNPALGMVISVQPYDVPPPATSQPGLEQPDADAQIP